LEKEMFKEEKKKEREGGRVGGKSHERRKKIKRNLTIVYCKLF